MIRAQTKQSTALTPPKVRIPAWEIEVFYDGECPLCTREIRMLKRMDRRKRIKFIDLASESFSAESVGKSMEELMDEIHARQPDGSWIRGLEVFRQLYSAVGLKPIVCATRLPLISHGLEFGYRLFAKNRLRLTGRCDVQCRK